MNVMMIARNFLVFRNIPQIISLQYHFLQKYWKKDQKTDLFHTKKKFFILSKLKYKCIDCNLLKYFKIKNLIGEVLSISQKKFQFSIHKKIKIINDQWRFAICGIGQRKVVLWIAEFPKINSEGMPCDAMVNALSRFKAMKGYFCILRLFHMISSTIQIDLLNLRPLNYLKLIFFSLKLNFNFFIRKKYFKYKILKIFYWNDLIYKNLNIFSINNQKVLYIFHPQSTHATMCTNPYWNGMQTHNILANNTFSTQLNWFNQHASMLFLSPLGFSHQGTHLIACSQSSKRGSSPVYFSQSFSLSHEGLTSYMLRNFKAGYTRSGALAITAISTVENFIHT